MQQESKHMPSTVPTMEDFGALEQRVTVLEQGGTNPVPPDPIPPDPEPGPDPGTGVQAKRSAFLCELEGVNTFSSMDTGNVWGSWPADYRPATVIKALKWIVDGSGYQLPVREYHYSGRLAMQQAWFTEMKKAFPDMKITLCPGANAPVSTVDTMVQLPHDWIEGLNEPNTDFGSGEVPYPTTKAIQDACWARGKAGTIMGPSIVAGTPHPEGWITGYCGTQANLDALNAKLNYGNGHFYPPGSPDVPNTGYSVNEYIGGLWGVYGQKSIFITEYCSLLYNSQGHKDPDTNGDRSAYYTLTSLFRYAQNGTLGVWWYALFDYGTVYKCGLFPTNEQSPRKDAYALRALCQICADPGATRRSFAPGKLDYTVDTGNDAAISHALYQSSDGKFYITLWRSLANPGGSTKPVKFTFKSKPGKVEEFDLMKCLASTTYTPVQVNTSKDGTLTSQLDGSARIIRVTQ